MSTILQIIISVALIYFIFSLLVYIIVEWIAGLLEFRGTILRSAIYDAFNDNLNVDFGALIYSHPQVEYLKRTRDNLPSYIPARNIALALIDLVKKQADPPLYQVRDDKTLEYIKKDATQPFINFKTGLSSLNESHFKNLLISLSAETIDFAGLRDAIEKWYNDYMDRVTGWYKKKIRSVVLLISFIVTVSFNVDSLYIIKAVTADPALRGRINILASQVVQDSVMNQIVRDAKASADSQKTRLQLYLDSLRKNRTDTTAGNVIIIGAAQDSLIVQYTREKQRQFRELNEKINSWDLPVGWNLKKTYPVFFTLLGWFVTIIALSAGAPFWFDVLKRLVNARSSGIKPTILQ